MRRLAALLVIASLVFAASAFAATPVSWRIGTNKTVTIRKGGSVKWTWTDRAPHNVKGSGFKSRTVAKKGFTYTHRFTKRGTFKVICQVHPTSMKTTVKVK
jgi:plastocyanin